MTYAEMVTHHEHKLSQPRSRGQKRGSPVAIRFWAKVKIGGPTDCWLWQGAKNSRGYGRFHVEGTRWQRVGAHRIAYEMAKGPIPNGLQTDHLCRTPACVNPTHLETVTSRTNTLRGINPRSSRSHCGRGHEYQADNFRLYLPKGATHPKRVCRVCHRIRERTKYQQRRAALAEWEKVKP